MNILDLTDLNHRLLDDVVEQMNGVIALDYEEAKHARLLLKYFSHAKESTKFTYRGVEDHYKQCMQFQMNEFFTWLQDESSQEYTRAPSHFENVHSFTLIRKSDVGDNTFDPGEARDSFISHNGYICVVMNTLARSGLQLDSFHMSGIPPWIFSQTVHNLIFRFESDQSNAMLRMLVMLDLCIDAADLDSIDDQSTLYWARFFESASGISHLRISFRREKQQNIPSAFTTAILRAIRLKNLETVALDNFGEMDFHALSVMLRWHGETISDLTISRSSPYDSSKAETFFEVVIDQLRLRSWNITLSLNKKRVATDLMRLEPYYESGVKGDYDLTESISAARAARKEITSSDY